MSPRHRGSPGTTAYYLGWGGMSMPRTPTDPATEAEATSRTSYYIATYDDAGRLATFTKMLNGRRDWADEYAYHENGELLRRTMTRPDGSVRVEDYDDRGKLIR